VTAILVRFYGRLAEEVQPECSLTVGLSGLTIADLRQKLAEIYAAPSLLGPRVRAAVGDEMALEDTIVRPGDEVDFLAPLSGG
jgi:molybdopterin converting factor small subunit